MGKYLEIYGRNFYKTFGVNTEPCHSRFQASPSRTTPDVLEIPMIRSFRLLALAGLTLVGAAACSDDDSTGAPQTARVRVVHASPNAPSVDVLVDDATALSSVPYRAASDFLTANAGPRRLRVRAAGTTTTVIDATVTLASQESYTVLATGLLAGIQPLVVTDTLTAPAAGQVKVRVIHGAPAASNATRTRIRDAERSTFVVRSQRSGVTTSVATVCPARRPGCASVTNVSG
jgi:hypothetical protein